ncbi:MAG: hypothetical protein JMM78_03815 [Candidatus Xiphinematobacter sp.]|nr:MAG: hypothetical protein JMM78_03815 [Candidatus Xiphinematobacter sp.]
MITALLGSVIFRLSYPRLAPDHPVTCMLTVTAETMLGDLSLSMEPLTAGRGEEPHVLFY